VSEEATRPQSQVDARVQAAIAAVNARHEGGLPLHDPQARAHLERMVRSLQTSAATLAAFALTNADEPVNGFVAREVK
jgi:hypothetical protein